MRAQLEQSFDNAKVLVTGGLGFIGSNLVRRLSDYGARVIVVDNLVENTGALQFNLDGYTGKVETNIFDICWSDPLKDLLAGQDYVFHLAAQTSHAGSMSAPLLDLDVNAKASLSLLEACRQINPDARVVFASTRQIYGKPDCIPVNETHPLRPVDINGIHKLAAEYYLGLYHHVYQVRSTILRLTNTYGPRMRVKDAQQMFLGLWIKQALQGEIINVFGDGKQVRDFNYVDDVVDALLMATDPNSVGKIYNVGGDEVSTLLDLAKMLVDFCPGSDMHVVPFPPERKAIDIGDYQGDYARLKNDTGWHPRVGLAEGIERSLRYYSINQQHYW